MTRFIPALEPLEKRDCPSGGTWQDFRNAESQLANRQINALWSFKDIALIHAPDPTTALRGISQILGSYEFTWEGISDDARNLQSQIPPTGFPTYLRANINATARTAVAIEQLLADDLADVADALANIQNGADAGVEAARLDILWRVEEQPLLDDYQASTRFRDQRLAQLRSGQIARILYTEARLNDEYARDLYLWQKHVVSNFEELLPTTLD